jgi:hypothetical protein
LTIASGLSDKVKMLKSALLHSQAECYADLFNAIYVRFDLSKTNEVKKLVLGEIDSDYFLHEYKGLINKKIKDVVMETYIRLNSKISYK